MFWRNKNVFFGLIIICSSFQVRVLLQGCKFMTFVSYHLFMFQNVVEKRMATKPLKFQRLLCDGRIINRNKNSVYLALLPFVEYNYGGLLVLLGIYVYYNN